MPRKASDRPFKIQYWAGKHQRKGLTSASSPEGVVRAASVRVFSGEYTAAHVYLSGEEFARILTLPSGAVTLKVL